VPKQCQTDKPKLHLHLIFFGVSERRCDNFWHKGSENSVTKAQ